jgi:hypothetical protein
MADTISFEADADDEGIENESQYIIKTEDGDRIAFTSMLEFSASETSTIAGELIEKGSFAMYNRVVEPIDIKIRLGINGEASVLQKMLADLRQLKTENKKVSIIIPNDSYEGYMLESFDWRTDEHNGYDALFVDCSFKEIREIEDQKTTSAVSEPPPVSESASADGSCVTTEDVGEVQGYDPSSAESAEADNDTGKKQSTLFGITGRI